MKTLESEHFGSLRLGVIETVDQGTYRCSVRYPGSVGGSRFAICNPSSMFGFVPAPGTICAIFDRQGLDKRILFPLSELDTRTPEETQAQEQEEGNYPKMDPGECFIGRHGRAFFNAAGDVHLYSESYRALLELLDSESQARLTATNFSLRTPGTGIRIRSSSSLPTLSGDQVFVEKNIPAPDIVPGATEVLVNLAKFGITSTGSFMVDVLRGQANLSMTALGEITLENIMAGLSIAPDGECLLSNNLASLDISANGSVALGNDAVSMELKSDGSYGLTDSSGYGFSMTPAGSISVSGLDVSLSSATGPISLSSGSSAVLTAATNARVVAAATASLEGAIIKLGAVAASHVALAEPISAILTAINAFCIIAKAHTHVIVGTVLGAGSAVGGFAIISPELASSVIPGPGPIGAIGSTTVMAQV